MNAVLGDRTQCQIRVNDQGPNAYRLCMQDAVQIRGWKRRSTRAVVAGLSLMAIALVVSSWQIVSAITTTFAAIVGLVLLCYGVHLAWLVFYEREPDGPSS